MIPAGVGVGRNTRSAISKQIERLRIEFFNYAKIFLRPFLKRDLTRSPSKKEILRREIENLIWGFDREKLYEEVWQRPVYEVAKDYKVSGVYLGKVCKTLRVPVPPRGYWEKIKNGKKVKRPKLPVLRY